MNKNGSIQYISNECLQLCNELRSGNWTNHWDNTSLTPFATNGNKLITYDNPESIMHKVRFFNYLFINIT